ncbi:MAG TPA: PH domain-containing protein [Jatrophihabitantaceae bacterium]|nr:PH domain-containing protein [Jatrophihabitantaceae bacterium]
MSAPAQAVDATTQPQLDWKRLSPRMLLIHPVIELGKALPAMLGAFLAGHGSGDDASGSRWSLGIAGVVMAFAMLRWVTTRYRITPEQVQLRHGLIRRQTRAAPLDRVRTVDVTAHLLHRALGLARVSIGTGTSDRKGRHALVLDGLGAERAAALRSELLHRAVPGAPSMRSAPIAPGDTELARLDPGWLRFAPFTLTGAVTGLALLGVGWRIVGEGRIDVQRLGPYRAVAERLARWPLAVDVLAVFVTVTGFVAVASTVGYVLSFSGFRLTRHDGGTLHVTRGLLTSRATSIERRRLHGVELSEPLLLRAVGGARCLAVATGLRVGRGAERGGEILLPPAPVADAVSVGSAVLETGAPLTAPLVRHPSAARRRRIARALAGAVAVGGAFDAAVLLAGWDTALLSVPGVLVTIAVALAHDRYRSLGHAFVHGYVVSRFGSIVRRRTALAADGVIGWNLRSTFFQRRLGLTTLVATTAAGRQKYAIADLSATDAVRFADACVPGLLEPFLT